MSVTTTITKFPRLSLRIAPLSMVIVAHSICFYKHTTVKKVQCQLAIVVAPFFRHHKMVSFFWPEDRLDIIKQVQSYSWFMNIKREVLKCLVRVIVYFTTILKVDPACVCTLRKTTLKVWTQCIFRVPLTHPWDLCLFFNSCPLFHGSRYKIRSHRRQIFKCLRNVNSHF